MSPQIPKPIISHNLPIVEECSVLRVSSWSRQGQRYVYHTLHSLLLEFGHIMNIMLLFWVEI